jgi:hypothetical protein
METKELSGQEPLHSSDFNWLKAAQQGAYALATATMVAQEVDSQVLQAAAQLVEELGSPQETFAVNESSITTPAQTIPNPYYSIPNPTKQDLVNAYVAANPGTSYTAALATIDLDAFTGQPWVPPQTLTIPGGSLVGNFTINQLIKFQSEFASQSGGNNAQEANTVGSAIGAAQAEESQNIQISQQYVTAETNKATSTDPQAVTTATSELNTLYQGYSQWAQMSGSVLNG